MNLAFIGWLQHAGLALSIGLASCLNAAMLYRGLRRGNVYVPQPGWTAFGAKLAAALLAMAAVLWFAAGPPDVWLHGAATARALRLAVVIGLGMLSYFGMLAVLGFRLRDFRRRAAE